MIKHWQVWPALRIRNLGFRKIFSIRKQSRCLFCSGLRYREFQDVVLTSQPQSSILFYSQLYIMWRSTQALKSWFSQSQVFKNLQKLTLAMCGRARNKTSVSRDMVVIAIRKFSRCFVFLVLYEKKARVSALTVFPFARNEGRFTPSSGDENCLCVKVHKLQEIKLNIMYRLEM